MSTMRWCILSLTVLLATWSAGQAIDIPRTKAPTPGTVPNPLPISNLPPSKLIPDLCVYRYKISTASPECQAFFDQGLGYLYSYVWMEAARSFETATYHDPNCAIAYWGLSRSLERWGRGDANKQATKAHELKDKASWSEQQLILARMQEKGLVPNVGDADARKKAAIETLDKLLAVHDDDEEAWFARAQLASGNSLFGGNAAAVPFYKALLKVNPLHPGASHELVHFYEGFQRPALGWGYSEDYIKSSPGIPHPWHMQSHLATRLGRWNKSSTSSSRAIELERKYHKDMAVKPTEDHQFSHHLEVLFGSLLHDGRYREARWLKQECLDYGFKHPIPWFRLHLAERDWDAALKAAEDHRKRDKLTASYLCALVYLAQNDPCRACPEVDVLAEAFRAGKKDKQLKHRLWETQGLLLCQTDGVDAGLKLLQKCVDETKNDYSHHAWGNGAYHMEVWGLAALHAGRYDVAEEAFLEALAHDSGSVKAAMGLQVMCENMGRQDEARQYADLARRFWKNAEVQSFDTQLAAVRENYPNMTTVAKPTAEVTTPSEGSGR
jgi:tetratricopeptide (TPR) repeat protein